MLDVEDRREPLLPPATTPESSDVLTVLRWSTVTSPLVLIVLFEVEVEPDPAERARVVPPGWTRVVTREALTAWNHLSGTTEVLLPSLLHLPEFTVLAASPTDEPEVMVAGAVLHRAGEVLSLSNVWSTPGHDLDWAELVTLAGAIHPGRAVTGYARGASLELALDAGFADVGPQSVWAR